MNFVILIHIYKNINNKNVNTKKKKYYIKMNLIYKNKVC